jgi:hypothetical protein
MPHLWEWFRRHEGIVSLLAQRFDVPRHGIQALQLGVIEECRGSLPYPLDVPQIGGHSVPELQTQEISHLFDFGPRSHLEIIESTLFGTSSGSP